MMPMNKDRVSDERLALLIEGYETWSKTASAQPQIDFDTASALRELQQRRAADRRAPAVVTEEMVERACDAAWGAFKLPPSDGSGYGAMRAALEAALAVRAEPAAVKPLTWTQVIPGRMFADLYMIERLYLDDWRLFLRANNHGDRPKFIAGPFSLEEAKAAAQARSALVASPADPVQALVEETGSDSIDELRDMAIVGHSLMKAIEVVTESGLYAGWAPADDPAEIVIDLHNDLVEASPAEHAAPSIPAGYRLVPEEPVLSNETVFDMTTVLRESYELRTGQTIDDAVALRFALEKAIATETNIKVQQ